MVVVKHWAAVFVMYFRVVARTGLVGSLLPLQMMMMMINPGETYIPSTYSTVHGETVYIARTRMAVGEILGVDEVRDHTVCIDTCRDMTAGACEGVEMYEVEARAELDTVACTYFSRLENAPATCGGVYVAYMPGKQNVTVTPYPEVVPPGQDPTILEELLHGQPIPADPSITYEQLYPHIAAEALAPRYILPDGRSVYREFNMTFEGQEIRQASVSQYANNYSECIDSCWRDDTCRGVVHGEPIVLANAEIVLCLRYSHILKTRRQPYHTAVVVHTVEEVLKATDQRAQFAAPDAPPEPYILPNGRTVHREFNMTFEGQEIRQASVSQYANNYSECIDNCWYDDTCRAVVHGEPIVLQNGDQIVLCLRYSHILKTQRALNHTAVIVHTVDEVLKGTDGRPVPSTPPLSSATADSTPTPSAGVVDSTKAVITVPVSSSSAATPAATSTTRRSRVRPHLPLLYQTSSGVLLKIYENKTYAGEPLDTYFTSRMVPCIDRCIRNGTCHGVGMSPVDLNLDPRNEFYVDYARDLYECKFYGGNARLVNAGPGFYALPIPYWARHNAAPCTHPACHHKPIKIRPHGVATSHLHDEVHYEVFLV